MESSLRRKDLEENGGEKGAMSGLAEERSLLSGV